MRRAIAIAVALGVLAGTQPASAEAPSAPEHDAAFRSGLDQYAHGNNAGAIVTWERLLGTLGEERGYKVLYNLGLAHQAIGDVTRAIERYDAFISQVRKRDDVPKELANRAADAEVRLDQLQRSHGAVRVRPPTRGGLVLTRLGTSDPRAAGYVVWLAPGRHELELFVGTDHVKRVTVDVERGKTVEIDTTPPEDRSTTPRELSRNTTPTPTPAPKPAPRPEGSGRSSTWIWVGAGATIVSFALPLATFVVASNQQDEAVALGRGNSGYDDARSRYETWKTMHHVSYALPAALALATVAYVVFRPSATSSTTVGIAPGGLSLGGVF